MKMKKYTAMFIVLLIFFIIISPHKLAAEIIQIDGHLCAGDRVLIRFKREKFLKHSRDNLNVKSADIISWLDLPPGVSIENSNFSKLKAVQETSSFQNPPHLFVNTHPAELGKPGLIKSIRLVRELNSTQQITLEIHEKAITNCSDMKELQEQLQELGQQLLG